MKEKNKKADRENCGKKGNKKGHITNDERVKIEGFVEIGLTIESMAESLGRGKSTISEEIKRGKSSDGVYRAKKANEKAYFRQYRKKKDCLKVSMNKNIQENVIKKTKAGISPEGISAQATREENNLEYVSAKAIRNFIDKRRPDLERFLFWNRNGKKSGPKRKNAIYLSDIERKFIEKRVDDFGILFDLQYGHWEGDFITSKYNSFVILVLVERSSKHTLIDILPNRKNASVNKRISSLLESYTWRFTFEAEHLKVKVYEISTHNIFRAQTNRKSAQQQRKYSQNR